MTASILTLFVAAAIAAPSEPPGPYNLAEHRLLADSAFAQTLRLISSDGSFDTVFGQSFGLETAIWNDETFADLVVQFAADDARADRYQVARSTVWQQLTGLDANLIDGIWNQRQDGVLGAGSLPIREGPKNAVARYALHHVLAIRFAARAALKGPEGEAEFRAMLAYEAAAQGYLQDALSSSHMLVPKHDFLPWMHLFNTKRAHDHYAVEGAYVVNGMGTAYEAFGDGALTYYASDFRAAMDAARSSLATVVYVYLQKGTGSAPARLEREIAGHTGAQAPADAVEDWLASHSGRQFYSETHLPGLLHIPTPVSAAWAVRDSIGAKPTYYPQFAELGFHDPDLPDFLKEGLLSKSGTPEQMEFGDLGSDDDIRTMIDTAKAVTSVEFFQDLRMYPSFHGIVFEAGAGAIHSEKDDEWYTTAALGLGFGLEGNLSAVGQVEFATDLDLVLVGVQFGANLPDLPFRFELGPLTSTRDVQGDFGMQMGAAWDVVAKDLGFTYGGFIMRLRYDVKVFKGVIHGPSVQIVVH